MTLVPFQLPGASDQPVPEHDRTRSRALVRALFKHSPGGPVSFAAAQQHRVRIHASAPVNGRCQSGDAFVYRPGDIDVIPAGASEVWEEDAPSTALVIELSPWIVARAAEGLGRNAHVDLSPRHQFRDALVEHIARAFGSSGEGAYPGGRLYAESLGLALASHLLGSSNAPPRAPRSLSKAQRTRVFEYIEAHLDKDLSLPRLASVAGMSLSHFKVLFKRSSGLTVHEYVVRRRVERARELLLSGERSISDVALDVGFAHASHLARSMRRVLGVLPSALKSANG
jgi:AraC family transcriptional regulator